MPAPSVKARNATGRVRGTRRRSPSNSAGSQEQRSRTRLSESTVNVSHVSAGEVRCRPLSLARTWDDDEEDDAGPPRRSTILLRPCDLLSQRSTSTSSSVQTLLSDDFSPQPTSSQQSTVAAIKDPLSQEESAFVDRVLRTLRGSDRVVREEGVGRSSVRFATAPQADGPVRPSSDTAHRLLDIFEATGSGDCATHVVRNRIAECVDLLVRGRYTSASTVLLDRANIDKTVDLLASFKPAVRKALDTASRRSLPYVAVPRQVLDTLESATRLTAVADALALPCDSETYGSLQATATDAERGAANLVLKHHVITAVCDSLREAGKGHFDGTEAFQPSRPGSPTAAHHRSSGDALDRRVLSLWCGLYEATLLCMRVGDSPSTFRSELVDSRMLGTICHAICHVGRAKHRTLSEAAARLLRLLVTENGLVSDAMLDASVTAVSALVVGYPAVLNYMVVGLKDVESASVRWDVSAALEALLHANVSESAFISELLVDTANDHFSSSLRAAVETAAGDSAEPALRVCKAHLLRVAGANDVPGNTDPWARAATRSLHAELLRCCCSRLVQLFKQAYGSDIVPRPRPSGCSAAAAASQDDFSRLARPTAASWASTRTLDRTAVVMLLRYVSFALQTPLTRPAAAEALNVSDASHILRNQLAAIRQQSQSVTGRGKTQGGVLFGILSELVKLHDEANKSDER